MVSGAAVAGKRAERNEHDAYFTPDELAAGVVASLRGAGLWLDAAGKVLEPGCGGGAFLRAARAAWPYAYLRGIDLDPKCDGPGTVEKRDFFGVQLWGDYDLILGNPPFVDGVRFVRHSLDLVKTGGHVAFLLPLSFLGGPMAGADLSRRRLWADLPLRAFAQIMPRPSFTGGGTAAQEYGVMIWRKGFKGRGELLPPLVWR